MVKTPKEPQQQQQQEEEQEATTTSNNKQPTTSNKQPTTSNKQPTNTILFQKNHHPHTLFETAFGVLWVCQVALLSRAFGLFAFGLSARRVVMMVLNQRCGVMSGRPVDWSKLMTFRRRESMWAMKKTGQLVIYIIVSGTSRWWNFSHFFFSSQNLGKMNPIWLIFFKWVETTNQICWGMKSYPVTVCDDYNEPLPSWEQTYPIPMHFWVDDFPNFPFGGIWIRSLEGTRIPIKQPGFYGFRIRPVFSEKCLSTLVINCPAGKRASVRTRL